MTKQNARTKKCSGGCQDAKLIRGLGRVPVAANLGSLSIFVFKDHSSLTKGTGYPEGEGKGCAGSGTESILFTSPSSLLL